ncbi:uncharacterized protein LOC144327463 [Podarcis muralis]
MACVCFPTTGTEEISVSLFPEDKTSIGYEWKRIWHRILLPPAWWTRLAPLLAPLRSWLLLCRHVSQGVAEEDGAAGGGWPAAQQEHPEHGVAAGPPGQPLQRVQLQLIAEEGRLVAPSSSGNGPIDY